MELETFKIYCRAFFPDCYFTDYSCCEYEYVDVSFEANYDKIIARFIRKPSPENPFVLKTCIYVWLKREDICDELTEKKFINKLKALKKEINNVTLD